MEDNTEKNIETAEVPEAPQKKQLKWRILIKSPLILIIPVAIFLLFYSDNSYLNKTENQAQIDELKAEIKTNIDSAAYYERKAAALDTDPESLEKIAREQYGMKCDNEDVYITQIK